MAEKTSMTGRVNAVLRNTQHVGCDATAYVAGACPRGFACICLEGQEATGRKVKKRQRKKGETQRSKREGKRKIRTSRRERDTEVDSII